MDQKPTKDYANQIKRLRARMGLTQANLAERLGVSFPTVYHCGTSTPQLVRVQDPFSSLLVCPFGRTQTVRAHDPRHVRIEWCVDRTRSNYGGW